MVLVLNWALEFPGELLNTLLSGPHPAAPEVVSVGITIYRMLFGSFLGEAGGGKSHFPASHLMP